MNDLTIYHNPKCSKEPETLALLRARGVEPRIIEYLKTPPTAAELRGDRRQAWHQGRATRPQGRRHL